MTKRLLPFYDDNYDAVEHNRIMMSGALGYTRMGYRVFPLHTVQADGMCTCGQHHCTSAGKHPRTEHGVKDASSDQELVKQWWQNFVRSNVGLATGHGLVVIDIDPRHGGALETLEAIAPLPRTATIETGGGGWHLYFTCNPDLHIRNSAGLLGAGIDVRGEGGYVVAPPSVHASGSTYRVLEKTQPAPLPEAFLRLLLHPKEKKVSAVQPGKDLVISEGQRNDRLFSLAAKLRHWGANDEVVQITLKAANDLHCQPPIDLREVQQIVASSKNREPATVPQALRVFGYEEAMNMIFPEPKWAVERFLPEGVTLLGGKPKMGKSWLALWLSLSVASGLPALDCLPTTQGDVLYLALEDGARRLVERAKLLLQGRPWPEAFMWANECAPLGEGGLTNIEAWLKAYPTARLVVIDTLVRVRGSGNGGSIYAEEYAGIVPIKALAEQYHVAILVVHHLRKAGATDAMDEFSGSTGLTGATDCNMVLRRERGSCEGQLHMTGRDVEEQTLYLLFDKETARWSLTDSPDDEKDEQVHTISRAREEIIALLKRKACPLSPADIAQELKREQNNIRGLLFKMLKDKEVSQIRRGLYGDISLFSNGAECDNDGNGGNDGH